MQQKTNRPVQFEIIVPWFAVRLNRNDMIRDWLLCNTKRSGSLYRIKGALSDPFLPLAFPQSCRSTLRTRLLMA